MSYDTQVADQLIASSPDLTAFLADFNLASVAVFSDLIADRIEDLPEDLLPKQFFVSLLRSVASESRADIVAPEMVTSTALVSALAQK